MTPEQEQKELAELIFQALRDFTFSENRGGNRVKIKYSMQDQSSFIAKIIDEAGYRKSPKPEPKEQRFKCSTCYTIGCHKKPSKDGCELYTPASKPKEQSKMNNKCLTCRFSSANNPAIESCQKYDCYGFNKWQSIPEEANAAIMAIVQKECESAAREAVKEFYEEIKTMEILSDRNVHKALRERGIES